MANQIRDFNRLNNERVIIVHGFGGHRWLMAPLARRLRQAGFATTNWGYHSIFHDIETHAARLRGDLLELAAQGDASNLHIVAHSMGSLVVRQALLDIPPAVPLSKLQRIVLLCPPNHGSHAATRFTNNLGRFSRTLTQLSDAPDSYANKLPSTLAEQYPVAIIAAQRDFVVELDSTYLPSAQRHTVIPGLHSSMLFNSTTAALTIAFLREQAW